MTRAIKPPASPRLAILRAKARREALALAAELRAEAAARATARRKAAHAARVAHLTAPPPPPQTPTGLTIAERAEARERANRARLGF